MKKTLLAIAFAGSSSAFANYSINFDVGYAQDSVGQAVSINSLAVVVVDTNNDGFSQGSALLSKSLSLGSVWGSDDVIIAVLTASDSLGKGGINYSGAAADIAYTGSMSVGDPIAVFTFPSITDPATAIIGGTSYCFFAGVGTGTAIPSYSDTNWKVPADGGWNLNAYTPAFFTDLADQPHVPATDPSALDLRATLTVPVPEPSTYALMGLGLVVVGLIARRKNA